MKEKELDAVIITDEKNMHYYSGFYKGEGYLVIRHDKCFLVTDFRYTEYAGKNCPGFEIADISQKNVEEFVSEEMHCGFEDLSLTYARYDAFSKRIKNLVPVGDMTRLGRIVKDEGEIRLISRAAKIADMAFDHICGFIRVGMTEIEIAAELEAFMRKCGAEKTSFDTIVAAGPRGSLPHAMPTENTVKNGDLVVMDYGCVVGGYASDMTRTVGVGKISAELMDVYNTVLCAQIAALDAVKAGVKGCVPDGIARSFIDSKYPGSFGHSLGHGVGLDIHEAPGLSQKSNFTLECGSVVTVEPGIYLPGKCGVRIEDLVVVTENGCDVLSNSPKNLMIVG